MRSNEVVVRALVREWLLEAADAEAAGEKAADAFNPSSLESMADELDAQIDAAVEKIQTKAESLRQRGRRLDESIGIAFVLGGLMSIPTLIKWAGKAISLIIKGYAKAVKAFGATSHAESAESKAAGVEALAMSLYEKGHHFIQGLFQKFVRAFLIGCASMAGLEPAEGMTQYLDTAEGEKRVKDIATILELGVTCVLAFYSATGAYEAFTHAHTLIAGAETVLTAVKGSHIIAAISEAVLLAGRAIVQTIGEAGISIALAGRVKKIVEENWSAFSDLMKKLGEAAKDLLSDDEGPGDLAAAPA